MHDIFCFLGENFSNQKKIKVQTEMNSEPLWREEQRTTKKCIGTDGRHLSRAWQGKTARHQNLGLIIY